MTFSELREEVRRRLRESSSAPVMWSDADIDQSLNEGLDELADACEFHLKFQRIELLLDHRYYDMRTVLRDDFLVLGPAFNETTNRWLIHTNPREMEARDLRWEERIAEPERVMARSLWWVGYWPIKGVATGEIKQYYVGLPDALEEDDDVPPVHNSFHYGLVEYALWDLFAQDRETDLAWAAWKEYQTYETKLRSFVDNRAYLPMARGWRPSEHGV